MRSRRVAFGSQRASGRPAAEPIACAEPEVLESISSACLSTSIAELKPSYSIALRRADLEEATFGDLARELGLTSNNTAVHLHRARGSPQLDAPALHVLSFPVPARGTLHRPQRGLTLTRTRTYRASDGRGGHVRLALALRAGVGTEQVMAVDCIRGRPRSGQSDWHAPRRVLRDAPVRLQPSHLPT